MDGGHVAKCVKRRLLEAVLLFVRELERMSSRARKQCGPAWAETSDAVQAGRQDDLVRVSSCQIQQCCSAHSHSEIAGMWEGVRVRNPPHM